MDGLQIFSRVHQTHQDKVVPDHGPFFLAQVILVFHIFKGNGVSDFYLFLGGIVPVQGQFPGFGGEPSLDQKRLGPFFGQRKKMDGVIGPPDIPVQTVAKFHILHAL